MSRKRTRGRRKSKMKDVNNILCEEAPSSKSQSKSKNKKEDKKKEDKIVEKKEEKVVETDDESCLAALIQENSRSIKDRILVKRFFVAKSYSEKLLYITESYIDAVRHCPDGHVIIDSDGIKVYPAPQRKVSTGSEYVLMRNRSDEILSKYRDLQEAINNCPSGYHIYDSKKNRVY